MTIFAVDDEPLALEHLTQTIRKAAPEATVCGFRNTDDTLDAANSISPDVAFLDIKLRAQSGVELAARLVERFPRLNVIFTTGFREYMETAFQMHVSGYIVKPVTEEDVQRELNALRFPVAEKQEPKLRVRTFGDFEVFLENVPLKFGLSKTKELFAILIDKNGALCTNAQLANVLWEDGGGLERHGSYFQNLLSDLTQTLKHFGCENVLIRARGMTGVDKAKLDCDYYAWLDGDAAAVRSFRGKYMYQYSWAEETLAFLLQSTQE